MQKSLQILEKSSPLDYENIVITYNNIAEAYFSLGNYETADGYLQKCLILLEESSLTEYHGKSVFFIIAETNFKLGRFETALDFFEQTLDMATKTDDLNHLF